MESDGRTDGLEETLGARRCTAVIGGAQTARVNVNELV
jgi:hypothetical protein